MRHLLDYQVFEQQITQPVFTMNGKSFPLEFQSTGPAAESVTPALVKEIEDLIQKLQVREKVKFNSVEELQSKIYDILEKSKDLDGKPSVDRMWTAWELVLKKKPKSRTREAFVDGRFGFRTLHALRFIFDEEYLPKKEQKDKEKDNKPDTSNLNNYLNCVLALDLILRKKDKFTLGKVPLLKTSSRVWGDEGKPTTQQGPFGSDDVNGAVERINVFFGMNKPEQFGITNKGNESYPVILTPTPQKYLGEDFTFFKKALDGLSIKIKAKDNSYIFPIPPRYAEQIKKMKQTAGDLRPIKVKPSWSPTPMDLNVQMYSGGVYGVELTPDY